MLAGAGMVAIASAVGWADVREHRSKPVTLGVHPVADGSTILGGINEDADDRA